MRTGARTLWGAVLIRQAQLATYVSPNAVMNMPDSIDRSQNLFGFWFDGESEDR